MPKFQANAWGDEASPAWVTDPNGDLVYLLAPDSVTEGQETDAPSEESEDTASDAADAKIGVDDGSIDTNDSESDEALPEDDDSDSTLHELTGGGTVHLVNTDEGIWVIGDDDASYTLYTADDSGQSGSDWIWLGGGNDTVFAGAGDDFITLGDGDDVAEGGSGNDYLDGWTGNDTLFGNDGDDYLWSYDGDDILDGGSGNDTLDGESGNDRLSGGDGDDVLYTADGRDTLDGGAGDDVLILMRNYTWTINENTEYYDDEGNLIGTFWSWEMLDAANQDAVISGGDGNDTLAFIGFNLTDVSTITQDGETLILGFSSGFNVTVSSIEAFNFEDVSLNADDMLALTSAPTV